MTTAERAAEQSFPVFLSSLPREPLSGTQVYLLENSRLGLGAFVNTPQPAFPPVNFQNALGFPADVRPTHVGPRCTGKERDGESGLDYFEARYYSGAQGRFTSPDEPLNDQDEADPQSWNLYGYVRNNPLRFMDPTGQTCQKTSDGTVYDDLDGKGCAAIDEADKNRKPDVTVGVGADEARLIMLQGVGENLSSPHQWATVVSGGGQAAAQMLAPLPTAVAQKLTGNGSATDIALAALPRIPGVPRRIPLPGFRRVRIDMTHIANNHMVGGSGFQTSGLKTAFSEGMSEAQIENAVRQAYRKAVVVGKGTQSITLQGTVGNTTIEMIYDKRTQSISTAYPVR